MGGSGFNLPINFNSENNLVLEKMKKYQLLEKAMRDYPAGTKYHSVLSPNETAVSTGKFFIDGCDSVAESPTGFCIYRASVEKWGEIIPAEPEKTGLLDGKVAIQVNNEREFKLLMGHYKGKGWVWSSGVDAVNRRGVYFPLPNAIKYHDKFQHSFNGAGYKIVPFSDFAAECNIPVPVFVMKSEDGVPLYVGDFITPVYRKYLGGQNRGEWYLEDPFQLQADVTYTCMERESIDKSKAFHSKEAALKWIDEQNKPVEITKSLWGGKTVIIRQDTITIMRLNDVQTVLYPSDLEDILHHYNVTFRQEKNT